MPKIKVNNPRNVIDAHLKTNYFKLRNTGGPKGDKGDTGATGATGPEGPQGPTGATGRAATVAIGTTQTLNPGQSAFVNNVGTNNDAIFNFGIPQGDKGDKGDTGATGATGQAATVAVGTTTTLAPGSDATVTNSGTSSAAVFNFGVPQGATGATGAQGPVGSVKSTVVSELPASGNSDTFYLVDREAQTGTASGQNISFNNSEPNGEITDYDYKGDTTQQTYTGKNLFNSYAENSSIITVEQDGTMILTGNNSANGYCQMGKTLAELAPSLQSGDTVYLYISSDWSGTKAVYTAHGGYWTNGTTKTITEDMLGDMVAIYGGYQTTTTIRLMITRALDTSYEPYTAGPAPNPSYPQPVNTVTRRQEVEICGKNLFDKTKVIPNKLVNRDTGALGGSTNYDASDYMPVEAGKKYVYTNFNYWYAAGYDAEKNFKTTLPNYASYTMPDGVAFIRASVHKDNLNTAQFEQADTASSYEAYHGQTYELNLGKNIVYGQNIGSAMNGLTSTWDSTTGYVHVTGQATSTWANISNNIYPTEVIRAGTYTFSTTTASSNIRKMLRLYYLDGNYNTFTIPKSDTSVTFTITKDINRYCFYVDGYSSGDNIDETFGVMLEHGPVATTYAQYFTPLELCKIGTYQDYIWNDGGTWKIHKEVGKMVLDGSENSWAYESQNAYIPITDAIGTSTSVIISNNFTYNQSASTWGEIRFGMTNNNCIVAGAITQHTNLADFKTWLGTHHTSVYYALAAATDTAITDANLIAQLDALLDATLYNGQNNIAVTSSTQPTGSLDMTYAMFDATNRHKVYIWSDSDNTWQIIVQ